MTKQADKARKDNASWGQVIDLDEPQGLGQKEKDKIIAAYEEMRTAYLWAAWLKKDFLYNATGRGE